MTIHQLVAGFRTGDAISAEAEALDAVFKANGCGSAIWCMSRNTAEDARGRVGDLATLASQIKPDDIAILHLSIGSPANDVFRSLKCRKVIIYHNVTPAKFFERCNAPLAKILEEGRRAVSSLASVADINLADSAFNAAELAEMGYENPRVFPLVIDTAFGGAADKVMCENLKADGAFNVLFVGRVVPNKRHDKLLEVISQLRRLEPRARLVIAGSSLGNEAYKVVLRNAAKEMGLGVSAFWSGGATRHTGVADLDGKFDAVVFTEFLKPSELNACYAAASA
ncbi:MAG: glycosyltransferase, partial [Kiritimatiellaeota bacterium]|nr:glycosyltransferase [Kiritimatiellota bacterium]